MIQFRVEAPGPSPRTVAPPSPQGGSRLTERIPVETDWRTQASCLTATGPLTPGARSVWLYPDEHPRAVALLARDVCLECPVIDDCAQQPWPHVGVTAGVIHKSDGRQASERRVTKRCQQCNVLTETRGVFCCLECKDRWHYERKQERARRDIEPLLVYLGQVSANTVARQVGVSPRAVYRWIVQGYMSGYAADRAAERLGTTTETIWGTL